MASILTWVTDPKAHPRDPGFYMPDRRVETLPPKAKLYATRGFGSVVAVYDVVAATWLGHFCLPEGETVKEWIEQGRALVATEPPQRW